MAGIGVVYAGIVARRMRLQAAYKPEFEDWLFHVLLPFTAYAVLAISALSAQSHLRQSLFAVAAAVLLLLFIGIHNAWDAVTYHVFVHRLRVQQPGVHQPNVQQPGGQQPSVQQSNPQKTER
jgi:hypothetical protein